MEFTSVFDEAGRDVESEQSERIHTMATQAATSTCWPFLALAASEPEFEHRLALIEDRLSTIASEHGVSCEEITAPLREGFKAVLAAKSQDPGGGYHRHDCEEGCKGGDCKCTCHSKKEAGLDPKASAGLKCADCGHSNVPHSEGGPCACGCVAFNPRGKRSSLTTQASEFQGWEGEEETANRRPDEDEGVRFQCPDCHGTPMWFDMEKGLQNCQGACGGSGVVHRKRKADSQGGYSYHDFDFSPAQWHTSAADAKGHDYSGYQGACKHCGMDKPEGGEWVPSCSTVTDGFGDPAFDRHLSSIKQALSEGQNPLEWLEGEGPVAAPSHHDTTQSFEGTNPVALDQALGEGGQSKQAGVYDSPENHQCEDDGSGRCKECAQDIPEDLRDKTAAREPDPFA